MRVFIQMASKLAQRASSLAARLGSRVALAGRFIAAMVLLGAAGVLGVPVSEESPSALMLRTNEAQDFVDVMRSELSIDQEVRIVPVAYHPFVFAVEPRDSRREHFNLSMELGFLQMLSDEELRAALAHELGHVWIFTHHPYLQTERQANEIGMRLVSRQDLENLYLKLWAYEGTPGVSMERLLGPKLGDRP